MHEEESFCVKISPQTNKHIHTKCIHTTWKNVIVTENRLRCFCHKISLNHFFSYSGYKKKRFFFSVSDCKREKKRHSQCYWKVDNFITTFCRNRTANIHTHTQSHSHHATLMSLTKKKLFALNTQFWIVLLIDFQHFVLTIPISISTQSRCQFSNVNQLAVSGADKNEGTKRILVFLRNRTYVQHSPDNQFFPLAIKWIFSFWQIVPQAMSLSIRAWFWAFIFRAVSAFPCNSHQKKPNLMHEWVDKIQLIDDS